MGWDRHVNDVWQYSEWRILRKGAPVPTTSAVKLSGKQGASAEGACRHLVGVLYSHCRHTSPPRLSGDHFVPISPPRGTRWSWTRGGGRARNNKLMLRPSPPINYWILNTLLSLSKAELCGAVQDLWGVLLARVKIMAHIFISIKSDSKRHITQTECVEH